jgi:glycosyltransferase involved in cell wall biosynthesis
MTAVKRTDDLLTMLAGVRERGIDALLLFVGDGADRERLEQRAHDLGLARSCLFAGYQRDVAPWYAICDVVVLASASEGTPVTIIEALAAGRPVVATRVGGVPDVVEEGETGFLVRPGDTHALAERLEILARDPERRVAMGETGRERVLERYAVGRLVDDIDALYRELLEPATTSATSRR